MAVVESDEDCSASQETIDLPAISEWRASIVHGIATPQTDLYEEPTGVMIRKRLWVQINIKHHLLDPVLDENNRERPDLQPRKSGKSSKLLKTS